MSVIFFQIPRHIPAMVSHSLWIRVHKRRGARPDGRWDRTRVSLGVKPLANPTARVPR